jgi:hypothetical protein
MREPNKAALTGGRRILGAADAKTLAIVLRALRALA